MTAFTLTVESDDLARIFTNALAFFPARSPVKTALLTVDVLHDGATLIATGTDTYTIGRDYCDARNVMHDGPRGNFVVPIELNREGWADIEKQARADKGQTGTLHFVPGDALIFHPSGKTKAEKGVAQDVTGVETTVLVSGDAMTTRDVWSLCDELLTRLEERPSHVMTFDPALFVRFNKVKAPGDWEAEKVLDFAYQGESEPMLAKVGPTFVGAIMPVDRAKYAVEQAPDGQDGLW